MASPDLFHALTSAHSTTKCPGKSPDAFGTLGIFGFWVGGINLTTTTLGAFVGTRNERAGCVGGGRISAHARFSNLIPSANWQCIFYEGPLFRIVTLNIASFTSSKHINKMLGDCGMSPKITVVKLQNVTHLSNPRK